MKTTRKLTFHTDPAHGWLEVNRADLDALDIAHKITPYSYEKGSRVYLEEDCDASLFMETAKAAGWIFNITEAHADPSPVRAFERYQPRVTPAALINAAQRLGKLEIIHGKV
jgi:hypothetical protein